MASWAFPHYLNTSKQPSAQNKMEEGGESMRMSAHACTFAHTRIHTKSFYLWLVSHQYSSLLQAKKRKITLESGWVMRMIEIESL